MNICIYAPYYWMHIRSDQRRWPRFNEDAQDGPLNDSYQRGWVQNKAWLGWGSGFSYLNLGIYRDL